MDWRGIAEPKKRRCRQSTSIHKLEFAIRDDGGDRRSEPRTTFDLVIATGLLTDEPPATCVKSGSSCRQKLTSQSGRMLPEAERRIVGLSRRY